MSSCELGVGCEGGDLPDSTVRWVGGWVGLPVWGFGGGLRPIHRECLAHRRLLR